MKRRGYRFGVAWIADNDEPADLDPCSVAGYISTLLLADLFSVKPERVAADVVRHRADHREEPAFELTTVDGDLVPVHLADFLADNPEIDPAPIRALKLGESLTEGGGAAPIWSIKRVGKNPK